MDTVEHNIKGWVWATVDVLLAVFGLTIVLYPAVSLGNAVVAEPLAEPYVNLIVGILALGGAYPFVAGDWSLGHLGDYIFVLTVTVLGIGVVIMGSLVVAGIELPGSNPVPQAVLFGLSSTVAYFLVYHRQ